MADIFSKALLEKIDSAIANKQGKHKEKIQAKLLELQNFISTLDQKKQNVTDEDSYQKYVNFLKEAINTTIEQITAPTVDDFIAWVEQIVGINKNEDCNKLRKFLIKNYSDEISSRIDSILSSKDVLDKDNILFAPLLSEARKAVKKDCNDFLKTPDEFENKIDDFLKNTSEVLTIIAENETLSITKIEAFYSDEQKNNNIDFYYEIIKKIVDENQSLKPINDDEKDDWWVNNLVKRIEDIKKCINILYNTSIAKSENEIVKKLFLKFDNEMVDAKKGVVDTLDGFIENTWNEISDNYFKIKEYFDNTDKITSKDADWDCFPKKAKIVALTDDFNAIFRENPLLTILNLATKDITKTLNKSVKAIEKYEKSESEVKEEISEVFSKFTEEYEKKLPLLENLAARNNLLSVKTRNIKESIEGLQNGCESLENKDLISYLNEDFISDLNTYSNITTLFTEVLQQSGMTDELDWLNARLNDVEQGNITEIDFDEKVLRELLCKGLITLTITKTF